MCDVNGFSFVKNSNKYYDDCAKILGNMILRELAPTLHIPWSVPFQLDDPPIVPTTFGKMLVKLRFSTIISNVINILFNINIIIFNININILLILIMKYLFIGWNCVVW